MKTLTPFLLAISVSLLTACAVDTAENVDDDSAAITSDENDDDLADAPDEDELMSASPALATTDDSTQLAPLGPLPRVSVVFTVPKNHKPDVSPSSVEGTVVALADHAKAGSKVRVAMFQWSRLRVARAFVRAAKRGADVQIVVDDINRKNGEWNPAIKLLLAEPKIKLTPCTRGHGSCIGTNINHNKIFLFEHLDNGADHVVAQASQNMTASQTMLHNNMVIAQDEALFKGYEHYFGDLEARQENLNYAGSADGTGLHAFMFPRIDDPVVRILDDVTCKNGGDIHVAMAFFENRPGVAQALADLGAKGCNVKVVVRPANAGTGAREMKILRGGKNVDVSVLSKDPGGNHSKYLLIDAPFNGTHQKIVFTGSHNYTRGALRANDEVLLRVDSDNVYGRFLSDWHGIHDAAH